MTLRAGSDGSDLFIVDNRDDDWEIRRDIQDCRGIFESWKWLPMSLGRRPGCELRMSF